MVQFADRLPTATELRMLALSVGWEDNFDWDTMQASLDGSLRGVIATADDEIVGSGRLVGDGVRYFYVQDVLVRPDAAGEWLATEIVKRLLLWAGSHASAKAIIGLFASPDAVGVYDALGFVRADLDPIGMTRDTTSPSEIPSRKSA